MGSGQRLAAVAAVSHARHYHNHTQPEVTTTEPSYNINIFFVSITLCGVLVAVCAACWRRSPATDKPEDVVCRGVYTVSGDSRLLQEQIELPGPPPAYETVVDGPPIPKDTTLQAVVTEPCAQCQTGVRCDSGLPSYEAAVLLRDTRL